MLSDGAVMRAGLRAMLPERGFDVVAELEDQERLLERVQATRAQLVLAAPAAGGHEALFRALDALPAGCAAIVLLAVPGFRIQASTVGARYDVLCLPLNAEREELHAAIRTVLGPGPPLRVDELCSGVGGTLTPREQEVLRELAQGKANREIAETLWLSEDTVKSHLQRIYRKLGVSKRAEAVALYIGQLGAPQGAGAGGGPFS